MHEQRGTSGRADERRETTGESSSGASASGTGPQAAADRLERASYGIEDVSPWFGFVERFRRLRMAAWTIRYWQGGWRFRWRMVRSTLAFVAAALAVWGLLVWS